VRLEDPVLLGRGQPGVERQHFQAAGPGGPLLQRVGGVPDLAFAAEEDQNVAGARGTQLVDGVADGLGLIARFLVGAIGVHDRPVPDLDRIRPPGHLDHRHAVLARGDDAVREDGPPGSPATRDGSRRVTGRSPGLKARTRWAGNGRLAVTRGGSRR